MMPYSAEAITELMENWREALRSSQATPLVLLAFARNTPRGIKGTYHVMMPTDMTDSQLKQILELTLAHLDGAGRFAGKEVT